MRERAIRERESDKRERAIRERERERSEGERDIRAGDIRAISERYQRDIRARER